MDQLAFTAAVPDQAKIPPEVVLPLWATLEPVVGMFEPHINFLSLWAIVAANSNKDVAGILLALGNAAPQIVTAPAFEAQLFGMSCRVGANLWQHFHAPPAAGA